MSPVILKAALVRVSAMMAGTRAGRPGRGRQATGRPGRRRLAPLPLLLAAPLLLGAPLALAGCGTAAKPAASPAATFGGYPSYLPKDTLHYHSDTVLTGTVQRPALTNQGDGVRVKTPDWSVLVTVTGPQVPGEGLPYQAAATTCTWVVTLSGATAPVPIAVPDFTSIDDTNHVYRPTLVPGQPRPPGVLRPGQRVSFELRAVEAVGEGLMRWAPDGRNIVAKWDFVVEND